MKLLSKFCGFLLILSTTLVIAKPNNESAHDTFVQDTITAWMEKNGVPGVALTIYKKEKLHSYYFGYASRETKMPVTGKTIFELGSITKAFTGLLLADQSIVNNVNLKSSAGKYLTFTKDNSIFQEITLENLATHTAGFPFNVPNDVKTTEQLHSYLANWKTTAPIGSQWAYSNLSIGLLGYALENSTGKSIDELYRSQILKPLNMQLIGTKVPSELQPYYAQGYTEEGKATPPTTTLFFPAAGSARASGSDMAEFLKAAVGSTDTPQNLAKAMRLSQTIYAHTQPAEQGLGWVVYPFDQFKKTTLLNPPVSMDRGPLPAKQEEMSFITNALIDKTGGTEGFRSYIAVIPDKSGIVLLANRFVSNGELVKVSREILFHLEKETRDN